MSTSPGQKEEPGGTPMRPHCIAPRLFSVRRTVRRSSNIFPSASIFTILPPCKCKIWLVDELLRFAHAVMPTADSLMAAGRPFSIQCAHPTHAP